MRRAQAALQAQTDGKHLAYDEQQFTSTPRQDPTAAITSVQRYNHLYTLRKSRNKYQSRDDRFSGGFDEKWVLHRAQLLASCGNFEVPTRDMAPLSRCWVEGWSTEFLFLYGALPRRLNLKGLSAPPKYI